MKLLEVIMKRLEERKIVVRKVPDLETYILFDEDLGKVGWAGYACGAKYAGIGKDVVLSRKQQREMGEKVLFTWMLQEEEIANSKSKVAEGDMLARYKEIGEF